MTYLKEPTFLHVKSKRKKKGKKIKKNKEGRKKRRKRKSKSKQEGLMLEKIFENLQWAEYK